MCHVVYGQPLKPKASHCRLNAMLAYSSDFHLGQILINYKRWSQRFTTLAAQLAVHLYAIWSRPDCNKNIKTLLLKCSASKESISTFRFDV